MREKAAAREASGNDQLGRERARQAGASADRLEMENAARREELIEADLIKTVFDDEFGKVRAVLLDQHRAIAAAMTMRILKGRDSSTFS